MKSNRIDSSFHNEKANSYIEFESLTSNANESDLDAFKEEYTYNNASQNSLINNSQLVILSAKNQDRLKEYAERIYKFVKETKDISIEEIAYTLQISRHPMEERIAFIVDSVKQLEILLFNYINNNNNKINELVFMGGIKKSREVNPAIIKQALLIKDLPILGSSWVNGGDIDWHVLHANQCPSLVSIPGYPFEKKRHWLPTSDIRPKEKKFSDLENNNYYFNYNEPYLRDHVTFGEQVLLGVTHCSLAIESARVLFKNAKNIHINNFMLVEPIVVRQNEKIEIRIDINEVDSTYQFSSKYRSNANDNYKEAANGEFSFLGEEKREMFDLKHFIDTSEISYNSQDIYNNKKPDVYGDSLWTVKEAYVRNQEVVGKLEISNAINEDGHDYHIHPALLDGAMVSRFALLEDTKEPEPFIPFMIKKINTFNELSSDCYCHVKPIKSNDEMWEADLTLFDSNGTVLVELQGFVCKRVRVNVSDEVSDVREINRSYPSYRESDLLLNIKRYILDKISNITKNPLDLTKCNKNFMDLGTTSIALVDLSKNLASELDITLYPTIFFEYPSINDLATYFATEYPEKFIKLISISDEVSNDMSSTQQVIEKAPKTNIQNSVLPSHVEKEEYSEQDEPIAIIGLSGIMPQSDNLDEFWGYLEAGENLVTEIPSDRWDWREYYRGLTNNDGKTNIIWGGFMNAVDKFDAKFFGISPREARLMDPQQRLTLQLVWKAIEDAGYNPRSLSGSSTGLFMGVAGHDY
ncbi:beta-ketoacyl synthase N-terminal-like domain-containing protein, partial [Bacillus cereus]